MKPIGGGSTSPPTSEMLSSSSQQLVENVEGALVFGLADSSGLLQQVWYRRGSRSCCLLLKLASDNNTGEEQKAPDQDTGFNVGSNDVPGHVKVDADEFSLPTGREDQALTKLRTSVCFVQASFTHKS